MLHLYQVSSFQGSECTIRGSKFKVQHTVPNKLILLLSSSSVHVYMLGGKDQREEFKAVSQSKGQCESFLASLHVPWLHTHVLDTWRGSKYDQRDWVALHTAGLTKKRLSGKIPSHRVLSSICMCIISLSIHFKEKDACTYMYVSTHAHTHTLNTALTPSLQHLFKYVISSTCHIYLLISSFCYTNSRCLKFKNESTEFKHFEDPQT